MIAVQNNYGKYSAYCTRQDFCPGQFARTNTVLSLYNQLSKLQNLLSSMSHLDPAAEFSFAAPQAKLLIGQITERRKRGIICESITETNIIQAAREPYH